MNIVVYVVVYEYRIVQLLLSVVVSCNQQGWESVPESSVEEAN